MIAPGWYPQRLLDKLPAEERAAVEAAGQKQLSGVMVFSEASRESQSEVLRSPCGSCGHPVNPAQVKASPAGIQAVELDGLEG